MRGKARLKYHTLTLGFRNASADQQIETASHLVQNLKRIAPERRREVKLAQLEQCVDEVLVARGLLEWHRTQSAATLRNLKTLLRQMRMQASWAAKMMMAQNQEDVPALVATGLPLEKSKRLRVGVPGEVTELRAKVRAGMITVLWRSPLRRSFFRVARAEGTPENWSKPVQALKARYSFKDMVPGQLYWFRVQAWNPNGEGLWSSPISVRAI
jgi:hypothetical protein